MDKERSEQIYESLKESRRTTLSGIVTLNRVRRKMKCTTSDILTAASMNSTKKVGNVTLHTSIFDFGITSEDIRKSHLKDGKTDAYVPTDYLIRGTTTE